MSPERFISVTHRFIELSSDSWLAAGEVNRRSRRSATLDNASYDTPRRKSVVVQPVVDLNAAPR